MAFAASGGGHFTLLAALADVVPRHRRRWVTVEGPRSKTLAQQGEAVVTISSFDARHLNFSNPVQGIVAALQLRPQFVVSSGAGVVLTFVLMCRLLGARVIFLETMARVSNPSRTGQVLARFSDLHIVQWPELRQRFPDAALARPVLLPRAASLQAGGDGTFVSVGTHSEPFDRLLGAVDAAVASQVLPSPCHAQTGPSLFRSERISTVETLAHPEFETAIAESEVVIGHCGAGLIASALRAGKRPIVMARRAASGEHVDDHQFQLARKLDELGLVVCVEQSIDSAAVVRAAQPIRLDDPFVGLPDAVDLLESALGDFTR